MQLCQYFHCLKWAISARNLGIISMGVLFKLKDEEIAFMMQSSESTIKESSRNSYCLTVIRQLSRVMGKPVLVSQTRYEKN